MSTEFINAGVYCLDKELIKDQPDGNASLESDWFPSWIQNKKVFGYARIDSLSKQEYLLDLLNSEQYKEQDLYVKCKYNKKFRKFIPIEEVDVNEPDQHLDIKKYIKLLK